MPPIVDTGPVISHRTTAGRAPENTLAGLVKAKVIGCGWVELDAKITADGVPILFHDETLLRTANRDGRVAETPYEVMRSLDVGGWYAPEFAGETVPTLSEALDLAQDLGLGLNIEIKPCPGRERATANVVMDVLADWDPARFLLSSFDVTALGLAHDALPDVARALLVEQSSEKGIQTAIALGCEGMHVDATRLNQDEVTAMKAQGLSVRAFTVNDPARALDLFAWGLDAVFSDVPDIIRT